MIDADKLNQFCAAAVPFLLGLDLGCTRFQIDTPARISAFLAQCSVESEDFTHTSENLNYSAEALLKMWPKHFTEDTVGQYARNPIKIANCAYANRDGNGNEASGDGWLYRGRGLIQITFKDNYTACEYALQLGLLQHPEILEQPKWAALSACWFWSAHNLNELADEGDFEGITRVINGGLTDEEARESAWQNARDIWMGD